MRRVVRRVVQDCGVGERGVEERGVQAWLGACAFFCVLLLGGGSVHAATGLAQASLKSAESLVRGAEADIRSAQGSAGTADRPAKGSRRKLTQMRLGSARQRLGKAAQLLAGIAASDKAALPLRKRHEAALAAIAKIEAILEPKSSSAGKKPTPVPTAGGKRPRPGPAPKGKAAPRLHYKQEKLLKDARWYLRETEKYCKAPAVILGRMDGTGAKPVVGEVQGALASVELAVPKYNLAVKYIDQLPATHPDVAKVLGQIRNAGQNLGAMRSRLKAEALRLQKMTSLTSYPDYKKDFDLLGALSQRYGNFELLTQQPEKLARIIKEDGQSLKEFRRIVKTYKTLFDQKTAEGQSMEKRVRYVLGRRKAFVQKLIVYKQSLPKAIQADMAEAERLAKEAVLKKRPLWFGENSGIEQRFGWAEKKLLVLRAFGEAEAKPYKDKLAAARARIKQSAKLLEADIIASNEMPKDLYKAKDRNALIKLATETWAKEQKGAQVLAVRIPSETWARKTRWQWSAGAFHKVDYSKLQVQLLIKHDGKLAVVRPINLFRDHMKGDKFTAFPFDKLADEIPPQSYVLLTKIK